MKDAFYFSHDSNARHDPKLVTFINEYGLLGYSYFFILIELLREQDQYRLPLHLLGALTKEWQTPNNVITKEIIGRMIELRLLDRIVDNGEEYFISDSLCQRMSYLDSIRQKRSDAGKKGMAMRYHRYNGVITQPNKESKVKESKVKDNTTSYPAFEKAVFAGWNSFCGSYPVLAKIKEITSERRKKIKERYEKTSFRDFNAILTAISTQPFLLGESERGLKIDFDWLIKNNTNYIKVLESRYKDIKEKVRKP